MSLHKHHLLQVQEQIDFFQEGSRAAALPAPGAARSSGARGDAQGRAGFASSGARSLLAAPTGASSPLPSQLS